MNTSPRAAPRRAGVTAVHSLNGFAFTVPDLDQAQRFYTEFGLDPRREGERIDLYTHGHAHRWGSLFAAPGPKRLQYLSFGAYEDDFAALVQRLERLGLARRPPHRLGEAGGVWLSDPDGNLLQVVSAPKVSPDEATVPAVPSAAVPGRGAAPARRNAARVRPTHLSH